MTGFELPEKSVVIQTFPSGFIGMHCLYLLKVQQAALHAVSRSNPSDGDGGRVTAYAAEFVAAHPEVTFASPAGRFNESSLDRSITYWPGGWLKRIG